MKIKSKKFILSTLAGMIIGLLVSIFLRPTCWGPIVGVFIAAYLNKVSSPKEGAIVGAIVLTPIGIYATFQALIQTDVQDDTGILATILIFILANVLVPGIGALYGLIIGKLFQLTKDKKLIL